MLLKVVILKIISFVDWVKWSFSRFWFPISHLSALGSESKFALTINQIETFKRDGVLVVRNVLSRDEVNIARSGLHSCLLRLAGVDVFNLEQTASGLRKLSSTNGSGGVLDVFYEPFKLNLAQHPRIFSIISKLWECTFGQSALEGFIHPYGDFDCNRGYAYIDRIGFRVSKKVSNLHKLGTGKKNTLQRSLTPHLDCCPHSLYQKEQGGKTVRKWRPIQCFVALTDTPLSNQGGFEAAKGHHLKFDEWVKHRAPNPGTDSPPPCLGEFTAMRPQLDADVIQSIEHIPCYAGDVVFWDNRIPHANSFNNDSENSREVVYLGWLPDIELNRHYVADQWRRFQAGESPDDQWRDSPCPETTSSDNGEGFIFSDLGKKLMGQLPWEEDILNHTK